MLSLFGIALSDGGTRRSFKFLKFAKDPKIVSGILRKAGINIVLMTPKSCYSGSMRWKYQRIPFRIWVLMVQ